MNTSDLVDRLAAESGVSKADARKLVDTLLGAIAEAAGKDEEVSLGGFGKVRHVGAM